MGVFQKFLNSLSNHRFNEGVKFIELHRKGVFTYEKEFEELSLEEIKEWFEKYTKYRK